MWALLGVVLVADAMDLLDATITTIAAPTIAADLGGGPALIKWLSAAYALALGTLLVVGGRLGDRYGQRRLFLLGMAGFTLASAACGLSIDPAMLVVARVVQGAFGALLIPQGIAIMTKTFPRPMLAKAFSAFGPILAVAVVGGPVLAGFIINANIAGLGWRPIFLINIVLGGIGLIVASRLIPRDGGDRLLHVDLSGSALLGVAMFSLLLGLIQGSSQGWTLTPIACLVIAAPAFAGFCWRQAVAADPLIKRTLLKNRGFTSGLVMGLAFFAAVNGVVYVISLFLQTGQGYSAGKTSLALLPMTVGIMIASAACAALIGKLGRTLVLIGLLITIAGTGSLLAVVTTGEHPVWWQLAAAILMIGLGMGTCTGTIFDTALGDVGANEAGSASGSISAIEQLAAAIGSAAVTTVYFAGLRTAGQTHTMTLCLLVILGIAVFCLTIVPLLPRRAALIEH
jgi:EmrB/QacA subfamily drug resistance transporter